MSLTDARRMWTLAAREGGVHSHECRRLGVSGNPSQRAKDIADHVPFWKRAERRNGRPGTRFYADGFQPTDAIPVRPNGADADVGGGEVPAGHPPPDPPPVADVSAEPDGVLWTIRELDGTWHQEVRSA